MSGSMRVLGYVCGAILGVAWIILIVLGLYAVIATVAR
jgi:hypothetical protein